jgi:hypothetical protein
MPARVAGDTVGGGAAKRADEHSGVALFEVTAGALDDSVATRGDQQRGRPTGGAGPADDRLREPCGDPWLGRGGAVVYRTMTTAPSASSISPSPE